MKLGTLAALICIAIGFAQAILDGRLLFGSDVWFLVAIPFVLMGGRTVFGRPS